MDALLRIDPDYAAGETLVQFARMASKDDRVLRHTDAHDISPQYAHTFGDFAGATLRAYDKAGVAHVVDNRDKIAKFDGRLPHEVVTDDFRGERFSIIWYKTYDSRKVTPDPVLDAPRLVWAP